MNRRQAAGLLLLLALLAAGRLIRHHLLIGGDGRWRDPLWLDQYLPEAPVSPSEPPVPELVGLLRINCCPAESLRALPGVGPVLAERIAAARSTGFRFSGPADLERIKGIGPVLAARLERHLAFGEPCRAAAGLERDRRGPGRPGEGPRGPQNGLK